jgi:hypothetical protein
MTKNFLFLFNIIIRYDASKINKLNIGEEIQSRCSDTRNKAQPEPEGTEKSFAQIEI